MSENKNYGIIREQGEYMEPVPLTPEETAVVIEGSKAKESSDDKK